MQVVITINHDIMEMKVKIEQYISVKSSIIESAKAESTGFFRTPDWKMVTQQKEIKALFMGK